ncbi:MAG: hypothetical protein ACYCUV_07485 [Phycisphaerae bacterium]
MARGPEKHPFLEVSEARRDKPGGSLVTLVGDARIYCHAPCEKGETVFCGFLGLGV